jgi:hypothetical protein
MAEYFFLVGTVAEPSRLYRRRQLHMESYHRQIISKDCKLLRVHI